MATNPNYDFEGSSSIPQTDTSNPFRYVPPSFGYVQDKGKGRMKMGDVTIKSYFTPSSPSDAHGPQVSKSQMQPTLDDHWKKELRETSCEYIARWCATGCERNWFVFERIHTKRRNRLDQKWLNDLVYVQYNLRLRRNQLLNKRPDSDPIVLEDIDPTSDWVVESRPAEFDLDEDLDLDLDIETSVELEHVVQLNADPDPPTSVSQPTRTPVVGASSAQPRQKHSRISTLSQLASAAVAQPASGTTSTVAVGDDDDEEEPWGPQSNSDDDPEIDRHDLGFSGSSY
eukprot:PITA_35989